MKNFLENIERKRFKTLSFLTGSVTEFISKDLRLDIDESITPFEKGIIKDYAINEVHYFDEDYDYLISVCLDNYGHLLDGGSYSTRYNDGELTLDIDSIDHKSCSVNVKGKLYGNIGQDSFNGNEVRYQVVGIKSGNLATLKTEQQLVLEGERLYDESNYKMAFFMFFSAVESIINFHAAAYASKIHSELHYSLEYLSLDNKLRLTAKEALKTSDLGSVNVWSKVMETFNSSKDKRNLIAHGKPAEINEEDVDGIYFSLLLITSILNYGLSTFNDINRKIFK